MKLNLFFVVMDLLTLLAYPILFVQDKLRHFSRSKESIALANSLVAASVIPGR